MTRPKTWSSHWTWCQSSVVMQVTCWLSSTEPRHAHCCYRLWLDQWSLWELPPAGSNCHCSDLNVCLTYQACTLARTLSTEHPHWYWSSLPYNTTESCNWPSWPPSGDWQHPAWWSSRHQSGVAVYVDTKGWPIEILMKFLDDSLCEGEKFQLMGRVVRFILCQTPTSLGDDSICAIITSLV